MKGLYFKSYLRTLEPCADSFDMCKQVHDKANLEHMVKEAVVDRPIPVNPGDGVTVAFSRVLCRRRLILGAAAHAFGRFWLAWLAGAGWPLRPEETNKERQARSGDSF